MSRLTEEVREMTTLKSLIASTLVLTLLVVVGCASAPQKSTEEQIRDTIAKWTATLKAQDVDGCMTYFSDQFTNYSWGDREGAREFIQDAKDTGLLEDLDISTDAMEITFDGPDRARLYPIDITGSFGTLTFDVTVVKEKDGWKVIGLSAPGL